MALPLKLRFPSRAEVRRSLSAGRSVGTPLGRMVIAPGRGGRGHILFSVSVRVSKKSSLRNRIKRVLDGWAHHRSKAGLMPRADIVVFVSPAAAGRSPRDLRALADQVFARLRPVGERSRLTVGLRPPS